MKSLAYILKRSLVNRIKQLKRKPIQLIAYVFFIGLMVFSLIMMKKDGGGTSILKQDMYGSVVMGLVFLFTIPDLVMSLKNGSSFFRGADINLVFVAPIKPQDILLYGFIKQMFTLLISLFFIVFQLPNLYRFANVKSYAWVIILGGLFLLLIANSILKILIYCLTAKNHEVRNRISLGFKIAGVLVVAGYFYKLYILKSPQGAIYALLNNDFIGYVPVFGWSRNIFMAAIEGASLSTLFNVLLLVSFTITCVIVLYKIDMDYYEDVLATTELKETAIRASRNRGERVFGNNGKKPLARKVLYKRKGNGASAIFFRHILEYRKTGFGFINIATAIYAVIGFSMGFFIGEKDMKLVLYVSIYVLMILSIGSKWQQEMSRPYIFLIPENSFKKIVYATLVDNIKNLVDGSLLFIITGILFKSDLITIFLSIIAYVTCGGLFIYGSMLIKRFLGNTNNAVFTSLMRFLILILIVIPGIVIFSVLNYLYTNLLGSYFAYSMLILYNLIFWGIIILISKGIFENIEFN